jgi:hypothetical protein
MPLRFAAAVLNSYQTPTGRSPSAPLGLDVRGCQSFHGFRPWLYRSPLCGCNGASRQSTRCLVNRREYALLSLEYYNVVACRVRVANRLRVTHQALRSRNGVESGTSGAWRTNRGAPCGRYVGVYAFRLAWLASLRSMMGRPPSCSTTGARVWVVTAGPFASAARPVRPGPGEGNIDDCGLAGTVVWYDGLLAVTNARKPLLAR